MFDEVIGLLITFINDIIVRNLNDTFTCYMLLIGNRRRIKQQKKKKRKRSGRKGYHGLGADP